MTTPNDKFLVHDVNRIKSKALTVDEIQKNKEYWTKNGDNNQIDRQKIQEKYTTKSKEKIDEKRAGLSFTLRIRRSKKEKELQEEINRINENIKKQKKNIETHQGDQNKIREANAEIVNLNNQLEKIKATAEYKALEAKEAKNTSNKKKILYELRDELKNFISKPNFKIDSNNLTAIENKITEINELIAENNFKEEKNDAIQTLIDLNNEIEIAPAKDGVQAVKVKISDALKKETEKRDELVEIKAKLIVSLRNEIYHLFKHKTESGTLTHKLINERDLKMLIDKFELITQDDKSKIQKETLQKLRSFNTENADGSCYDYLAKEIDLASLADGMIKIYYDANELVKQYKAIINEYETATKDNANNDQKEAIKEKLDKKLDDLNAFKEKYKIEFDVNLLEKYTVDEFEQEAQNFLRDVDDKFTIGIHAKENIKNLEYLGSKPSLTQKANIFKNLNKIGGEYVSNDDKFWKKHGYFVDPKKEKNKSLSQHLRWFQPQDKNGELIGSKVIIRTDCEDPILPDQKCIRFFFDEDIRSCTGKLMKNPDFKNEVIVESPYWAPDSWVRTSKDKSGKIIKVLNDEKMMVFLDDKPGFAVALKKVQEEIQDPEDETKKIIAEVLRPTLFFNEKHKKILEGHDQDKKDKILNSVKAYYKDFIFMFYDSKSKKASQQMDMDQLTKSIEFMSFDQTKQTLSQNVKEKASNTKENAKSFVNNLKYKVSGFARGDS